MHSNKKNLSIGVSEVVALLRCPLLRIKGKSSNKHAETIKFYKEYFEKQGYTCKNENKVETIIITKDFNILLRGSIDLLCTCNDNCMVVELKTYDSIDKFAKCQTKIYMYILLKGNYCRSVKGMIISNNTSKEICLQRDDVEYIKKLVIDAAYYKVSKKAYVNPGKWCLYCINKQCPLYIVKFASMLH